MYSFKLKIDSCSRQKKVGFAIKMVRHSDSWDFEAG